MILSERELNILKVGLGTLKETIEKVKEENRESTKFNVPGIGEVTIQEVQKLFTDLNIWEQQQSKEIYLRERFEKIEQFAKKGIEVNMIASLEDDSIRQYTIQVINSKDSRELYSKKCNHIVEAFNRGFEFASNYVRAHQL